MAPTVCKNGWSSRNLLLKNWSPFERKLKGGAYVCKKGGAKLVAQNRNAIFKVAQQLCIAPDGRERAGELYGIGSRRRR